MVWPLVEGARALIACGGDMIFTSRVVEVRNIEAEFACFETMNSIYHVSLVPLPLQDEKPKGVLARCA